MNPDQLAALEEERDFLLRSISDLDREHEAGDVADDDYRTLRDDYTARLRPPSGRSRRGRPNSRRSAAVTRTGIVGIAAALSVLVVAISWWLGRSSENDTAATPAPAAAVSPCPPDAAADVNTMLVDARGALGADPSCALTLFRTVLDTEPENVEARTYLGWLLAFDAMTNGLEADAMEERGHQALLLIDSARKLDPSYTDAQCFAAIVNYRLLGDAKSAAEPLAECRKGDLPAEVAPLVQQLGAKIDAALAEGG
ncbi:MAG: hypothetical protein R2705_22170 [Ilumatobacteraceae bacterium]